jgi:hypothetical protein
MYLNPRLIRFIVNKIEDKKNPQDAPTDSQSENP